MSKNKWSKIITLLVVVLLLTVTYRIVSWHEPKYMSGRDTLDKFGKDNEYQMWRIPPYRLEDMENKKDIEDIVYRYYESRNLLYVEGFSGYYVIDVKNHKISNYHGEGDIPKEHLEIFKNKKFKEVQTIRFKKIECKDIVEKNGGAIGSNQFYLGYDKYDESTKEVLEENSQAISNCIRDYYKYEFDGSINQFSKTDLLVNYIMEKFSVDIKDIYLSN